MKRFFRFAISVVLVLIAFALVSCDKTDEDKQPLLGTQIKSAYFNVENNYLSTKVSNDTSTFSFFDKIETAENATYSVSLDISGTNIIPSKTVELSIGNNTFYIIVENGKDMALYTVMIRRRPIYCITFESGDNDVIAQSQSVEEDGFAKEPTETMQRKGYIFQGWDFDFSKPITADTHISVAWEAIVFEIKYFTNYYVAEDWNDMNPKTYTIEDDGYVFKAPKGRGLFCGWYYLFDKEYGDNSYTGTYTPSIDFDVFMQHEEYGGGVRLVALFDENAKGEFRWDTMEYINEKQPLLCCYSDENGEIVVPKEKFSYANTRRMSSLYVYGEVKKLVFQDSVIMVGQILGSPIIETIHLGENVAEIKSGTGLFQYWLIDCDVETLIIDSGNIKDFCLTDLLTRDYLISTLYIKESADVYDFIKQAYERVESDMEGYIKYELKKTEENT